MKSKTTVRKVLTPLTLTLSILTVSGCAATKVRLQPVYVLDGAHVQAVPREDWGDATNTTARAVWKVTDVWLEKVRQLDLASSGL